MIHGGITEAYSTPELVMAAFCYTNSNHSRSSFVQNVSECCVLLVTTACSSEVFQVKGDGYRKPHFYLQHCSVKAQAPTFHLLHH